MNVRTEHDALGEKDVPHDALWGAHTARARENFSLSRRRVSPDLIAALALVKRAAAMTNGELGYLSKEIVRALCEACDLLCEGGAKNEAWFPLDALQGGAGTSTNMNVNEVLANLALEKLGRKKGDYATVHPLDHVNLHQSTNDVYPTALRIAAITGLRRLSESFSFLQGALQEKEAAFQDVYKMGRTEMQPAVPMTLGKEFSAFAEAVARDRWRAFKCEERLRMVNLGGTAIGTGLAAPRDYIFRVIEVLRALTGMGLARSENLIDGTANADVFVEASGMLKAAATNIAKIAGDLRLLHFIGEIVLPPLQAGSSIMPGKINPVAMEALMQTSLVVRANDFIIGECAAHGTLQINEFMPLIAQALLESMELLAQAARLLTDQVRGTEAREKICRAFVDQAPTLMTALLPHVGYEKAGLLVEGFQGARARSPGISVRDFLLAEVGEDLTEKILNESSFLRLGSSGR